MSSSWFRGLVTAGFVTLHFGSLTAQTLGGQTAGTRAEPVATSCAASRPLPALGASGTRLAEMDAGKVDQLRKEIDELRTRLAAIPLQPRGVKRAPLPASQKAPSEATGLRGDHTPSTPELPFSRLRLGGRARFTNDDEFPRLPNQPGAGTGTASRAVPQGAAERSSDRPGIPDQMMPRPEAVKVQGIQLQPRQPRQPQQVVRPATLVRPPDPQPAPPK